MSVIKIDRLNEDHEGKLPAEILDMSVGQLLDRVGALDTEGDAEYEIVEDALIAIKDKILGNGYPADDKNFDTENSVEGEDTEEVEFSSDDDDEFPTFDQAMSNGNETNDKSQAGSDNFQF